MRRRLPQKDQIRAGVLAWRPTFRQPIQNLIPGRRGDVPATAAVPDLRQAERSVTDEETGVPSTAVEAMPKGDARVAALAEESRSGPR